MQEFIYSRNLDEMKAQHDKTVLMGRDAIRAASISMLLAVASWQRANPNKTQAEFGKPFGWSQPKVSNAVNVLKHEDAGGVLDKVGRGHVIPDDSVVYNIVTLVDKYMGKAVSGIYAEMFGREDKWNLSQAVATLIASAAKRDVPMSTVVEELLAQVAQTAGETD